MSSVSVTVSKAIVLEPTNEGISEAANNLKNGKIVAFATETVYGLGANALIENSVREIFKVKGRPLTDPLIVHVSSMEKALELIEFSNIYEKYLFENLGEKFWPGGLTLIAKQRSFLPLCLSAGTGYVGIRIPNHDLALRLLTEAGCPVAAPSANRFGHVSPTTHEHVFNDLGNHNISILNGDLNENTCQHGIESTVCKIDINEKELIIFRRGAVSESQIQIVLNNLKFNSSINNDETLNENYYNDWKIRVITKHVPMPENYKQLENRQINKSKSQEIKTEPVNIEVEEKSAAEVEGEVAPGQLITHYAPDVPTFILRRQKTSNIISSIEKENVFVENDNKEELLLETVIIDFNSSLLWLSNHCLAYYDISKDGNIQNAGKDLFKALRWSETVIGAKRVLITDIEDYAKTHQNQVIGYEHAASVSDRTFRAASGRVITVTEGQFPGATN